MIADYMNDYCGWSVVWVITSTDQEFKVSIIAVIADETRANEMVEDLDRADTSGEYSYQAVKKAVLR